MDLRVLEYFLMTAEEGSITHAAELLHVSQPTVSRQLMDLERELGKTLLVRAKRNVSLTKDGLLFRETAREILALYQKAVREGTGAAELSGELYLGMGETGSVRFLAEQIAAFQVLHPSVHFHLISENADRICEDIEKGLLDAGFVMRNVNPATFEILELGLTETWGVLVPEGHPLAGEPEVSGRQLRPPRITPINSIVSSSSSFTGRGHLQPHLQRLPPGPSRRSADCLPGYSRGATGGSDFPTIRQGEDRLGVTDMEEKARAAPGAGGVP